MERLSKTYLEIGKGYIEQKKFDLAVEQFKKICELGDDSEQALFELGKAYYLQNKFDQAIKALREATRVNPSNIHAYILLAKSYLSTGQDSLAVEEFKKASGMTIDDDNIHTDLYEFFREHKMYELAMREYEKLLKDDANKFMLLDLLQLYNFNGDYDKVARRVPSLLANPQWHEPYFRNRLLNELEISQKKLVLSSKPRILLVTLTNRCNLNCYMCGRGDNPWELSQEITEQVVSYLPFLELITWQGGEVFLVDRFGELFKKTFGLEHLKQIIITNALLITEEWAERIALRNNVGLTISIDSVDKETYEYIRRGASIEKLTQNLKIINKAKRKYSSNMTTTLRCTIMKANYKQLEDFMEFARDYEFDVVQMAPLSSDPFDPENIFINKDMEILKYITKMIPKIRELAKRHRIKLLDWIPTLSQSNSHIGESSRRESVKSQENEPGSMGKPVCFRPWKQLAMNVNGYIFPECLCNEPIGDVFKNTLEEVWNNEKMQNYRRGLSRHNYTDWCKADCVSGVIPPEHLKFTYA